MNSAAMDEHLDHVGSREIRSLVAEPAQPGGPEVVIVPGLGAPGYLTRLTRAVADLGARCTLLDLPGFGARRRQWPASPTPRRGGWTR
jgi:pimeloyl-ACP methyl ester carboxylesterase